MTLEVFPCFGGQRVKIPETESGLRLHDGRVVTIVGIHQEGPEGLTQCVRCVKTGDHLDIQWPQFWRAVRRGEIPLVSDMETLAAAASAPVV